MYRLTWLLDLVCYGIGTRSTRPGLTKQSMFQSIAEDRDMECAFMQSSLAVDSKEERRRSPLYRKTRFPTEIPIEKGFHSLPKSHVISRPVLKITEIGSRFQLLSLN